MEINKDIVAGFIPTRENFGRKFWYGVGTLIVAIAMVALWHPPILAVQVIEGFIFLALLYLSFGLIGKKVMRFTGFILLIFSLGMLFAIALGKTKAIGLIVQ